MIENYYKVPKKMWNRWNEAERNIFTTVYEVMLDSQDVYSHPKAAVQQQEYWTTTCWNAAWVAADTAMWYRKENGT